MTLSPCEIERSFEDGLENFDIMTSFCEEHGNFEDYVWENFKPVVELFKEALHAQDNAEDSPLWTLFLWMGLDDDRFSILVHAFCESNWMEFSEFVSEYIHEYPED